MKQNQNKWYICVENRVYSLTDNQYEKFKEIRDDVTVLDEAGINADIKFCEGLQYIEKVGKLELTLFTMFRY